VKSIVVMLILILFLAVTALADGVNFTNQYNQWQFNPSYACHVDVDNPDTTFGQESTDQTVWAEDDAGAVNRAILVDVAWDSIFGYGPEKIPNPSQVDSCVIDSAYFKFYVHGPSTTADSMVIWRLHTDIENDDTYATWNNPKSGPPEADWGGGGGFTLANDVIHNDDSVLYNNATASIWDSVKITDIWQAFTDSTSRRTGLAITIPTDDSEILRFFHNTASGHFFLRIWWGEYGVKSTKADSQRVAATKTNWINGHAFKEHNNYGSDSIHYMLLGKVSTNVGRGLLEPENIADSVSENLTIDSAIYHCKAGDASGSNTINCHKIKQWWTEGSGTGGTDACGSDWVCRMHGGGGEGCETQYTWATSGCDGSADRESSTFATMSISSTGWYQFTAPDSIAQGMYDNRNTPNPFQTNFCGVRLANTVEDGTVYVKLYTEDRWGTNNDPYWIFYYQCEVEPTGARARPASIGEPVMQGAYLK